MCGRSTWLVQFQACHVAPSQGTEFGPGGVLGVSARVLIVCGAQAQPGNGPRLSYSHSVSSEKGLSNASAL